MSVFKFPAGGNRGTVTHMNEKVMQFPLPPRALFSFGVGRREHILVIPAVRPGLRPTRAEVIPISTASAIQKQTAPELVVEANDPILALAVPIYAADKSVPNSDPTPRAKIVQEFRAVEHEKVGHVDSPQI